MFLAACSKKFEVLPEAAKQVTRSDRSESSETGRVQVREYRFDLADAGKKTQQYLCESRRFDSPGDARIFAKKAIAERPQKQLERENARFAESGRSVWLWLGNEFVWCMLATPSVEDVGAAMAPVVEKFRRQYEAKL